MTPQEIEAFVLAQGQAYQHASNTYGRGREERQLIQPINPSEPDPLAISGRRGSHNPNPASTGTHGKPSGGYARPDVMSYYVPIKTMAGGAGHRRAATKTTYRGQGEVFAYDNDADGSWSNVVRAYED